MAICLRNSLSIFCGCANIPPCIGNVALAITLASILPLAGQAVAKEAKSLAPPEQAYHAGMAAAHRKDFTAALRQFTIACDGLNGDGCFSLASAYETGEGTAPDKPRAVRLYDHACNLRAADACVNLGAMYYDGDGVGQSFERALASYRRALAIDPENEVAQDGLKLAQKKQAARH